jgi:hypothetical protein
MLQAFVGQASKAAVATGFVELFAGVEAAGAIGTFAPVDRLLDEWRATAAVYADPDLADRLRRPLPGDGPAVERPTTR